VPDACRVTAHGEDVITLSSSIAVQPASRPRRFALGAALVAVAIASLAADGRAQGVLPPGASASSLACRSDSARTIASALQGAPIASLRVVTAAPAPLPGAPDGIDNLHVRTREQTIRRQLLFAPGDSVDTLRVAESLRRLRRLPYLTSVGIVATKCADRASVDLAVVTRDLWSTQPSVKVRGGGSALVGVEERNVLGTGRDAKVYARSDAGQLGFGVAYVDPWIAGTDVTASVARDSYRDGSDWTGSAGLRERSVFDRWHADATLSHSVRESPAVTADTVRRESAIALVGRRISHARSSATALLVGAEYDEARVVAGRGAVIVGPPEIRREFLGLDAGITRRSATYGTASWYLPGGEPVDLPLALEGEAVVGIGRDLAFDRPAMHADAWLGRFWLPGDRLLLSADAWASGYRLGPQWSAGSLRLALGADAPAAHGRWSAHLATEQLFDPDPDVRALASADPTVAALPQSARLAETAVAASAERDVTVRKVARSYAFELAGFGAASMRWDPAAGGERPALGALGAGIRLTPTRSGMARIGLDVGFPVVRSAGIPNRPFIALTITPWLESSRMRDGRRLR
jgi:hypothetical protein